MELFHKLRLRLKRESDITKIGTDGSGSGVIVHELSATPTKAWEKLKKRNTVKQVTPMNLDTPISPDNVRFVCMSDTHGMTGRLRNPVPDGDIFIHAGDFTNTGLLDQVQGFNDFLGSLPHRYKIVIAGNHELTFDPVTASKAKNRPGLMSGDKEMDCSEDQEAIDPRSLLTNCTYLQDSAIQIYGLKIYGSPWQPAFGDWAFNLMRGTDCLEKWDMIPSDTDILITHGPPIGHGDLCMGGHRAGCVELLHTIQNRIKPKFHIYGHIHEGYGITTNGMTTFINASTCTLGYKPTNPPIVFDVPLPPGETKS